jgi:flagellar basal-body rod protein FlgC
MFGALDTAVTGVNVSGTWMDAIAGNIANVNTVTRTDQEPFRASMLEVQSVNRGDGIGAGVRVNRVLQKTGDPDIVFDPENPLADANGNVSHPVVDMSEEMTNMMIASRSYQANLNVMDRVRDAYLKALEIGRH